MQNPGVFQQSQESFKPVSREVSASLHSTRGESPLWSNSRANLSSGAATEVLVLSSCRRVSTNERATSIIAHQIIIPRASSVVRNNVVISLNPIQSPSQLIVGAPFVAESSHRRTESVETTLLSSSRQRSSGGELQLQITELHADVASSPPDVYHLYLPLLGSADGKRSGVANEMWASLTQTSHCHSPGPVAW